MARYATITVKYRDRGYYPARFNPRDAAGFFSALSTWLVSLAGGIRTWYSLTSNEEAIQASGTITITGADAGEYTAEINGDSAILVAGTPGNDDQTAADLAVAINTSVAPLIKGHVTAAAVSNVVTVTAVTPGICGNTITLAATGTGAVASGPRLTGGTNGTVSTYTNP